MERGDGTSEIWDPNQKASLFQFASQTSPILIRRQTSEKIRRGPYIPYLLHYRLLGGQSLGPATHPSPTSPVMRLSHQVQPWHSLPSLLSLPAARALAEQPPPDASERFHETFLPSGRPPLPGSLMHRPDLATVLDVLGTYGPAAFYAGGNLTLEMVAEVNMWRAPLSQRTLLQGHPFPSSFLTCLSLYIYLLGFYFLKILE